MPAPPLPAAATVLLARGLHADLLRARRSALPREACGLLLGTRGSGSSSDSIRIRALVVADNLARGIDRFEVDPGAVVRAERRALAEDWQLVGVWHSHPRTEPRPSRTDREDAFGGWIHVIVGPEEGAVRVRAYRIVEGLARELVLCPEDVPRPRRRASRPSKGPSAPGPATIGSP